MTTIEGKQMNSNDTRMSAYFATLILIVWLILALQVSK
jgi:hypothetical protein